MARQKVLLPYNFTQQDEKAVMFVLGNFSKQPDTEVVLFHAHTPVPEIEMQEARVMEKLRSNLSYLTSQVAESTKSLERVQYKLQVEGFGENRVKLTHKPRKKDIAAEIIELAGEENCNIIVVNRKPGKTTRFFTGSVHSKVINGVKNAVVCIVT